MTSSTWQSWPPCPARLDATSDVVHVIAFPLDVPERSLHRIDGCLTEAERVRAARFVDAVHRRRWIAGRATLRTMLADCVGAEPAEIPIEYGRFGKPELREPYQALTFNLSHSGPLALLAIAWGRDVGVDVEAISHRIDWPAVAARFFSRAERDELARLPAARQARAFFACWSRKEAYLKARGAGLSWEPAAFSVTVAPDAPPKLCDASPGSTWQLTDVCVDDAFAACIAWNGRPARIVPCRATALWAREAWPSPDPANV